MTEQHTTSTAVVRARLALQLIAVSCVAASSLPAVADPAIVHIVHSFDGSDGSQPGAEPLVRGPFGTVFGVTMSGGARGEGALFFLDSYDHFHLVHSFSAGGRRGWMPGSVFFSEGRLYGTTLFGGAYECGTAFRVALTGRPVTIHHFDCLDGNQPSGRVAVRDGDFYGTTGFGGSAASGSIHRLSPSGELAVLHEVPQRFSNEAGMYWGLVPGLGDEFIGATMGWDVGDFHGVIFKIDTSGAYSILHTFEGGSDGSRPTSAPVVTADGTIYGTTVAGGLNDVGTLYRITPEGDYSVVHTFGGGDNPAKPFGGLALGTNGNVYGTTTGGGPGQYGSIYEFTPGGEFTVIYYFSGVGQFAQPQGGLVEASPGVFYGMTGGGGDFHLGTIYKVTLQ